MPVVNATLCLPFKPAQEVIERWEQSVREACKRTCFPYEEEVSEVLAAITDLLPLLLHSRVIESISVDFALAEVRYELAYDAAPSDEDALDLDVLDLVLATPDACVITFTLTDLEKAAYLNCLDFESVATSHVSVVMASAAEETEEGE